MVHIGSLIKEEMQRQGRTVPWLARQICCERRNVYKIYSRALLDTELLLRISKALNHDFFRYYSIDE
ncbi:MAG: XRE family transcriptional regulator [Paludibacteraceae bacterium]